MKVEWRGIQAASVTMTRMSAGSAPHVSSCSLDLRSWVQCRQRHGLATLIPCACFKEAVDLDFWPKSSKGHT